MSGGIILVALGAIVAIIVAIVGVIGWVILTLMKGELNLKIGNDLQDKTDPPNP